MKITSTIVDRFTAAGGKITRTETLRGERADDTVHVLECDGRDGTYMVDNAGVSWVDAGFDRTVAALRSGEVDELPAPRGVEAI